MGEGSGAPVIAGLAIGIAFVALFASSFGQSQTFFPMDSANSPKPGQFREAAIKVTFQNSTFQGEFGERELVVMSYRDWGVGHMFYDCPVNQCAHISFADESDPKMPLVSVLVNMQSNKVVEIRAARDLLVSKTNEIEEVKFFLSRYPDADVRVNPGPGYSEVFYEVETTTRALSVVVRTTPIGEAIEVYAECEGPVVIASNDVIEFLETSRCLG